LTLLATASVSTVAGADDAGECSLYDQVDKYQLLRRISLDLRHQPPSYDEYRALDAEDTVPDYIVDEYLASDEFKAVAQRYHEKLYWPNLGSAQILSTLFILRSGPGNVKYLNSNRRSQTYRGGTALHACQNKPQTEIQPDYQSGDVPECEPVVDNGVEFCLEGWTEVHPYWEEDPTATVRVCAFDAQTAETASLPPPPNGNGNGNSDQPPVQCNDGLDSEQSPGCGCGPNLKFCWGDGVAELVRDELEEQLIRTVDDHTTGGFGYSDMLVTPRIHSNGRLQFYSRYLAQMSTPNKTYNVWHEGDAPLDDDPDFLARTWSVEERAGAHSGILTLPGYTLRFQTNRGRANRARIIFQNTHFEPSSEPDTEGCSDDTDDLTQRCTCRYCHAALEPLAAYFAPIAQSGSALMGDFESYREDCIRPEGKLEGPLKNFDPWCDRFWITDPDNERAGWRITHEFADEAHADIANNTEQGPAGLAESMISDGSFARGTVQHLFEHFIGREMNLSASDSLNEIAVLDELAAELQADDDFVAAVKRTITLEQYGRLR